MKSASAICRRAFLGALKVKYGSVHCEGFQRAIAKPFGRSRRSEIPLRHEKSSRIGKKHTPKISIAKRGYGEKSQIPLSSILPRKSAFEKPENSPNSLPSTSWCIKIGLQKRIWHACSPADFIPPQSQWRCNCPLPRRSAAHWMRENAVWAALERKKACA